MISHSCSECNDFLPFSQDFPSIGEFPSTRCFRYSAGCMRHSLLCTSSGSSVSSFPVPSAVPSRERLSPRVRIINHACFSKTLVIVLMCLFTDAPSLSFREKSFLCNCDLFAHVFLFSNCSLQGPSTPLPIYYILYLLLHAIPRFAASLFCTFGTYIPT